MLSDNTFRGIGHFEEDTSNVGTPFLRLGVKALLKSVLRLLYTMATSPLYNAHRKCPSRLPVLVLPNGCSINVLSKMRHGTTAGQSDNSDFVQCHKIVDFQRIK